MKTRQAPHPRSACLGLLCLALGAPLLHAQDDIKASTEYVPVSSGNFQKLENAVAQSDAIFIGEVLDPGAPAPLPAAAGNDGLLCRGVELGASRDLLGHVPDTVTASVYIVNYGHLRLLPRQTPYIIFLQRHRQSWPVYPFDQLGRDDASCIVIKLMPATEERVAAVEKQIAAMNH